MPVCFNSFIVKHNVCKLNLYITDNTKMIIDKITTATNSLLRNKYCETDSVKTEKNL